MDNSEQGNERNQEAFYDSLRDKLEQNHDFPEQYLFKFIISSNQEKLTEIYRLFDGLEYSAITRDSRNNKYISLSINAFVLDANQVVDIYQKAGRLEGVLML